MVIALHEFDVNEGFCFNFHAFQTAVVYFRSLLLSNETRRKGFRFNIVFLLIDFKRVV